MKMRLSILLGIMTSLIAISLSIAQGTCPLLVEKALQAIGDNCTDTTRNTACYGYNQVTAEFTEEVSDDFFAQPADITGLDILESIQTAEMSTDLARWGVAVMNLQANIPNSLPGQSVKFILLGDVEVESAVEPESGFEQSEGIEATLINGANIRGGAGKSFNVIGGATAGDTLTVDGQSADGEWYRTVIGNRIGWIFGELLEADGLSNLPVLDGTQRSVMQSFYLRTGFGSPDCEEAPGDTLMIQGPQGIEVDFTINGADIRIGSTITARILPPGDIIEFYVIDGKITIPGAGPDGTDLIIYENQRSTSCLTDPEDLGVDGTDNDRVVGCDWTEPEFVSDPVVGGTFCTLEDVPENLLNYAINVDCPGEDPIQIIIAEEPTEEPPDDPNLCNEGKAWGDGRCQTEYDWQAGYYFGLLEEGLIELEDIPEPFYEEPTPEPTEEPEEKKKKKSKFCSVYFFGEGDIWDIYVIATEEYVDTVFEDPGYPDCDFGQFSEFG